MRYWKLVSEKTYRMVFMQRIEIFPRLLLVERPTWWDIWNFPCKSIGSFMTTYWMYDRKVCLNFLFFSSVFSACKQKVDLGLCFLLLLHFDPAYFNFEVCCLAVSFHFPFNWVPSAMFVSKKFEEICKGKKIKRKSRRKEKVKENKKINLKSINYFYISF